MSQPAKEAGQKLLGDDQLYDELYDEEKLETTLFQYSQKESQRCRWFPRCSSGTKWLLVIDIVVLGLLVLLVWPLIVLLFKNPVLFPARPLLPFNGTTRQGPQTNETRIPRILHQTTPNATIPEKWIKTQQSCLEAYSDYEYKLWTDESARDFISTLYPWFTNVWDNYPFPIQRADAIRYFVLHHYGGVYLDMDTYCNKTFPLDELEAESPLPKAIFQATKPTGVTNDVMIATPNHPAFSRVISKLPVFYRVTHLWARFQPYANIMMSTGPLFLSLALTNFLLEQPLPSGSIKAVFKTDMDEYITDLQSCTWRQADAVVMVWIGKRPWTWVGMGFVGFVIGIYVFNYALYATLRIFSRRRLMTAIANITKTR